jgi:Peptidase family M28
MSGGFGAVIRAWGLAIVALVFLLFCYHDSQPHRVADASAPAERFSAGRAETVLARILGPERPHPVGSAENAAVRARIVKEFANLGVTARTYSAFTCNPWRKLSFVPCATVTDILADVIPGQGKAIVLLAHYDSVPAGPGASDDESGVATVLETVRALKARGGQSLHPLMAVITDGEEAGLLGANAFLQNAALKDRVGAVVNVEARGTRGPSLLFQTSPGDGKLIDLYAAHVRDVATSSLYAEIYKFLPNDTDLTLFIHDGFPSFNFAFADNVHYYHSPLDTRANLSSATLQMQGDNMLGVASGLEQTEYSALKGGNDVYVSLFGIALPRMPASWALPVSIVVFLLIAAAAWLAKGEDSLGWRGTLSAASMPFALIVLSALLGWALYFLAQIVSGHPEPTYAYPFAMRVALGAALWAATLFVSRLVRVEGAAASAWLWTAGIGIVTAALLPGLSPYFVFPSLLAAVLLIATARTPGGWRGGLGQVALFIAALAAFAIWFPLVVSGETLMGLRLHPLFTIPAAFGLITIVPLLAVRPMPLSVWRWSVCISALAALACAIAAGLMPPYSTASPQRVNLAYLEDWNKPSRWIAATSWKATSTESIPPQLIKAGGFRYDADAWSSLGLGDGYVAAAGAPRLSFPLGNISDVRKGGAKRIVAIHFSASLEASGLFVRVPKEAKLMALDVRACLTPDCRSLTVTFTFAANGRLEIPYAEVRYGLPKAGAKLQAARPATAMASQSGDETFLVDSVAIRDR